MDYGLDDFLSKYAHAFRTFLECYLAVHLFHLYKCTYICTPMVHTDLCLVYLESAAGLLGFWLGLCGRLFRF
jgi:hypothetical protein